MEITITKYCNVVSLTYPLDHGNLSVLKMIILYVNNCHFIKIANKNGKRPFPCSTPISYAK